MNWVLIIFIYSGYGVGYGSVTSIPMGTEAACQAAGVKATNDLRGTTTQNVRFSCSRRS